MATGSLHPTDVNLRAEAKVSARREGLQRRKKKAHPRQAGDSLTDGDILGLIVYFKYDCSLYDVADTLFYSLPPVFLSNSHATVTTAATFWIRIAHARFEVNEA